MMGACRSLASGGGATDETEAEAWPALPACAVHLRKSLLTTVAMTLLTIGRIAIVKSMLGCCCCCSCA